MEPNLTLLLTSGFLIACGVYLLLERSLTRILMGILLTSNGVNLLYAVIAGPAGRPAFVNLSPEEEIADPLPQAMVLTAIVITLATTGYMLALAYRAVQINGNDEVQDDVEDAVIRRLAAVAEASESFDADSALGEPGEEEGGDEPGDAEAEVGSENPAGTPDEDVQDDEAPPADDGPTARAAGRTPGTDRAEEPEVSR